MCLLRSARRGGPLSPQACEIPTVKHQRPRRGHDDQGRKSQPKPVESRYRNGCCQENGYKQVLEQSRCFNDIPKFTVCSHSNDVLIHLDSLFRGQRARRWLSVIIVWTSEVTPLGL